MKTMRRQTVPQLFVEQMYLGEIGDHRKQRIVAEMGEESVRAAMLGLEESNREILQASPPEVVVKQILARATRTGPIPIPFRRTAGPRRFLIPLAAAAAMALAVIVGLRVFQPTFPGVTIQDTTRVKGEPYLLIYRDTADSPELVGEDDTLRESDRIQIKYVAAGDEYGAIVSVDGRGGVVLHYPADAGSAPRLDPREAVALEHSYVLDDAPRFERFFFVTSDSEFSVASVMAAAAALAQGGADTRPLDLPPQMRQTWVLLKKEER